MHPAFAVRKIPGVAVVPLQGQLCVVATVDVAAGNVVMTIDGRTVAQPTRYTVQIGEGEHVDAEALPGSDGGYPVWRFLNHACEPNTRLVGRDLVAIADLRAGDQVTFDYDSTEWDMAAPFACACGAPTCRGLVRGFRHLTPAQRERMPWVAEHLRTALARSAAAVAGSGRRR